MRLYVGVCVCMSLLISTLSIVGCDTVENACETYMKKLCKNTVYTELEEYPNVQANRESFCRCFEDGDSGNEYQSLKCDTFLAQISELNAADIQSHAEVLYFCKTSLVALESSGETFIDECLNPHYFDEDEEAKTCSEKLSECNEECPEVDTSCYGDCSDDLDFCRAGCGSDIQRCQTSCDSLRAACADNCGDLECLDGCDDESMVCYQTCLESDSVSGCLDDCSDTNDKCQYTCSEERELCKTDCSESYPCSEMCYGAIDFSGNFDDDYYDDYGI